LTHDEKIIPTFKCIYRIRDGKTQEEVGEGRANISNYCKLPVNLSSNNAFRIIIFLITPLNYNNTLI